VIAEEETLIRRVDDDRVLGQAGGIEVVEQPADVVVDGGDTTQVVLDVTLVVPAGPLDDGIVTHQGGRDFRLHVNGTEVIDDPHRRCSGRVGAGGVVVEQGVRFGDVDVAVHVRVRGVGLPRTVRRLVVDEEAERLVVIERAEPIEREVGDDVGGVAGVVQHFGKGREPVVEAGVDAGYAVEVAVGAGEDRGPAR